MPLVSPCSFRCFPVRGLCIALDHFPEKWKRAGGRHYGGLRMTTPFDAPDWRAMSQEERDLGFNNALAVAGSGEIIAEWRRRSVELRARYSGHLDLRYGPRERNRV